MPHASRLLAAAALLALGACGPAEDAGSGEGAPPSSSSSSSAAHAPGSFGAAGVPRFTAVRVGDRTAVTVCLEVHETAELWIARIRLTDATGAELGVISRDGPGNAGRPVTATFDAPGDVAAVTAEITDRAGASWKRSWRMR